MCKVGRFMLGASNVAFSTMGEWSVVCVPVDLVPTDLDSDPRFLGGSEEGMGPFGGFDEKSHSIECFSQLEHRGDCSSHYPE